MGIKKRIIRGEGEMEALAQEVADKVMPGDVLLLYGDLGAGKTTFTKSLANFWGVKDMVTSPSFTIVSEYAAAERNGIETLIHADLYRLGAGAESDPSVADVLERAAKLKGVTVIEWADRLTIAVSNSWQLYFDYGEEDEERIVRGFEKGRRKEL